MHCLASIRAVRQRLSGFDEQFSAPARRGVWAGALVLVLLLLVPAAQAQLISPGKLSSAHADIEGIRNCTSCHALGNQGVEAARCLDCHEPLKARIDAGRGYHARLTGQNCGDCHKEHFGRDFQLVRFDTTRFDHRQTGFQLAGAHREVGCRSCHQPAHIADAGVRAVKRSRGALERTYLGLAQRCRSCHTADSPHQNQFSGADCASCHTPEEWDEATRFDHDKADFRLIGRHRQVACASCHPQASAGGERFTRFEGIAFANCSSCHQDPHGNAFGADCQSCHSPAGWQQIRNFDTDRFDHTSTGFALVGRHAALECASCHARPARNDARIQVTFVRGTEGRTFPRLDAANCQSCHTDYHAGAFAEAPGGAACENCHGPDGWMPVDYGLERHNREADFALAGAHLVTPCSACHAPAGGPPTFDLETTCQSCHADDNPHGTQFAGAEGTTACADCHAPDGWALDDFDHATTDFPLTGRHAGVECAACHQPDPAAPAQFRDLETTCQSCHADPHAGQFAGRTCEACHTTEDFALAAEGFDHSTTRFPLTGAHQGLACQSCHRTETGPDGAAFLRFRPLGTACKDCHSDG